MAAALPNLAIGALRPTGHTNIAAGLRKHGRDHATAGHPRHHVIKPDRSHERRRLARYRSCLRHRALIRNTWRVNSTYIHAGGPRSHRGGQRQEDDVADRPLLNEGFGSRRTSSRIALISQRHSLEAGHAAADQRRSTRGAGAMRRVGFR